MKVIVSGAGQVGYNIARQLANEHNDVTVVDRSEALIQRINDTLDVQGLVGHGAQPDVLERAGAPDAEMIIAVTAADETNMVICQVAHSLFDVPRKIARIRNQAYLDLRWRALFSRDHMPIDVIISPEREVAHAVLDRLDVPGAFETMAFMDDMVRVVGTRLEENCPVVNTPLRQLTELFPDLLIVVTGVYRDGRLFVPSGDDQMFVGDEIYFAADINHVDRALSIFGHEEREARNVVVIGGGNIGLFLAEQLETTHPSVHIKLIEENAKRAEIVADRLTGGTIVLSGDGLDEDVLRDANVRDAETVVTLTNDDETNILAALLAKQAGAERTMALVASPNYAPLQGSLGIDVFIDPRATTVSTILEQVRRGRIRSVRSIRDGGAEIIEAEALETSPLVGKALRDIELPSGIMIGAIRRHKSGGQSDIGDVVIPRGGTRIEPGDRVVVFALKEQVGQVEQMFRVGLEFFT
ncbi:MAG: Trk system potassium transporter TrkA [Alphaproteobacteria bacterium]